MLDSQKDEDREDREDRENRNRDRDGIGKGEGKRSQGKDYERHHIGFYCMMDEMNFGQSIIRLLHFIAACSAPLP